jgi:hypothetical protein
MAMKNALSLILLASVMQLAACSRPTSSAAPQPKSSAPVQPSPAAAMPQLSAGECGAPDGARGFVRIRSGDLSGAYQRCSFELSNGGVAAMEAKQVGDKESSIIVLSLTKTGAVRCEKDSPVAVNYRAQNPARALYVANAGRFGKCEISNNALDAKHWAGKLTATLVPGGQDRGKTTKPIQIQAEWDIRKP